MKWINKNNDKYFKRYLKPMNIIVIAIIIIETIVFYTYPNLFFNYLNVTIIGVMFIPSLFTWAFRAKYNLQSIEIIKDSNTITITYFSYNDLKKLTCRTKNIYIELRSRYQSIGYWTIYCENNFVLKQENIYLKSDLDILQLHEELKKHLPTGCVVTV